MMINMVYPYHYNIVQLALTVIHGIQKLYMAIYFITFLLRINDLVLKSNDYFHFVNQKLFLN